MIQGISMVRIMEKNIKSTLKVSLVNCTTLEVSLVNCTPHEINLVIENGLEMAIPSSGIVARVSSMQESAGEIYSCIPIPLNRNKFGCVENLPEPKPGTMYIVSAMVLAASDRTDLVAPDTGATALRNTNGQIIAVRGFIVK